MAKKRELYILFLCYFTFIKGTNQLFVSFDEGPYGFCTTKLL